MKKNCKKGYKVSSTTGIKYCPSCYFFSRRQTRMDKVKYLYKHGDKREAYEVGRSVSFRWHKIWRIEKVKYNELKDYTTIRLRKLEE